MVQEETTDHDAAPSPPYQPACPESPEFRVVRTHLDLAVGGDGCSGVFACGPGEEQRGPVKAVEVVILSTMLTDRAGLGEWGFSALVEADGHRILFDTGYRPETVLKNAGELKIDLSGVTDVILSHHHGDHVGGLVTLRRELAKHNPDALKRAYVGAGIVLSRPGRRRSGDQRGTGGQEGVRGPGWVVRRNRAADRAVPGCLADRPGPAHPSRAELEFQTDGPIRRRPVGRRQRPRGYVIGA